jgi:hypothetical protein|tara:strand:+ start:198 stop:395 length:198 start_codon:yes stop_codon:yes gene_type:complete
MKVEDINIGDLVRVWGWGELLVVSDIYFHLTKQIWCFDAYGLESRQMNDELSFDQEEITVVSRAA